MRRPRVKPRSVPLAAALLVALTACAGPFRGRAVATYTPVRVVLRPAAADTPRPTLYLRRVDLVRSDGSYLTLASYNTPRRVALSGLSAGEERLVADATIPAGAYPRARLRLLLDNVSVPNVSAGLIRETRLRGLDGTTLEAPVRADAPAVYGITLVARVGMQAPTPSAPITVSSPRAGAAAAPTMTVEAGENARLRIYQASPDAGAVDVAWHGMALADGLAFEEQAHYRPVPSGGGRLSLVSSGDRGALADRRIHLAPGKDYTVVVAGLRRGDGGSGVNPLLYRDVNAAPPAGSARLRIIDVATGVPDTVSVAVTAPADPFGVPQLPSLGFGQPAAPDAAYMTLGAGSYRLRAGGAQAARIVADTDPGAVALDDGGVYTSLLVGDDPEGFVVLRDR